ncbi:hypothetical protein GCM10011365_25580 [Marinicella pacifica]|uniref:HEPN AbiU2-like domain-containing protein n=1 Tax=Marinicella pacifica TaxID=1171543 RepID=A0A917FV11_9GAMM|nr:hypothetical protein [Marinicella pacifica]GGG03303.1 hypothetical protein GCM10011365_25580 [Marinicella pacifica]
MNEQIQKSHESVRNEVYQLLVSAYCYNRKFGSLAERIKKESRAFLLEEVTALRHLSNGIVLHLCNLDDDDGWSLRTLRKAVAKEPFDDSAKRAIKKYLKKLRSNLNNLKTKHRNQFIAHRLADEYPDPFELLDFRTEFKALVQQAVSVFEKLWGKPVDFGFYPGSQDRFINFKEELDLS